MLLILFFDFIFNCSALEIITVVPNPQEAISVNWKEEYLILLSEIYTSAIDWHKCSHTNLEFCISMHQNSLILLDLSEDLDIQYFLSKYCQDHFLVHLVYQDEFKYIDDSAYSIVPSLSSQKTAFLALMNYFNWTKGAVFNKKSYSALKDQFLLFSNDLSFLTVDSLTNIEDLISQSVVRMGATLYYLWTSSLESQKIQNALSNSKLLQKGSGILLNQESGYNCSVDGSLIITEIGMESIESSEEYFKTSIKNIISVILDHKIENYKELLKLLDTELPNHYKRNNFSIVNIQNQKRIIVGSIVNRNIQIFGNLIFPGNTNSIPDSAKKILHLSITAGTTNPGGSSSDTTKLAAMGAFAAQDEINVNGEILANFQIDFFNFDCGVSIFNATFARACYSKDIDKLGHAHLTAFGSSVAIGQYKTFTYLNATIPSIGGVNGDGSLSSIQIFPFYVRMFNPLMYSKWSMLLYSLGWKKIAVIYENSLWGEGVYKTLDSTAKQVGLEIINPESLRHIPGNLDRDTVKDYIDVFQAIVDSQARMVALLLLCPLCNYAIELFYDLGLKNKDVIFLAGTGDVLNWISTKDEYMYKRAELGVAMMRLSVPYWVGNIGKRARSEISLKYNISIPNTFGCCYYDSTLIAANALDFMINRGLDYSDPYKLMATLRNTKFIGCTGPVSISKGTNDRNFDFFYIEAIKLDNNRIPYIYLVGNLYPFGTQVISYANPLIYSDGSTIKPTDLRNELDKCPFPDKLVKTFNKGRGLLFGICITVCLMTAAITFIIWKKWWNISIEELKEKQEISFQDFVVGATIAIEFIQFSNMGPDYSIIGSFFYSIGNIFSMDLEDVIKLRNGIFWIVVDVVFGGIALWVILCIVVLLRLDEKWSYLWIFKFLGWLGDILMPILGNLCFIPFVSVCLDIFVCDQSISDDFTDSFLASDCFYFCWKDAHLYYAILSCFALIAYEPLAVFCRPLWQELQPMLHVKTLPLFLMVKTVVQSIFIGLNKTLKRSQDIAHGAVFILLMICYLVFVFKVHPYNYGRYNWWQGLSLVGVVWLSFWSTIAIWMKDQSISYVFLIILVVGWIALAIIGFYVQIKKYPSLLFSQKSRDTSMLFKFAFTFGKKSKVSLSKMKESHEQQKIIAVN
ncbi:unnamed protein product [Blepharisma stoltei]|uniref:Receptor ligand binding region domain-containing protein n=1 Tax=Blepharisma stoltei TaxID=1481888 RepID=A0AAU9ITC5_9CILI|nr:unnamed protein product [Blepharisma stoltei]